MTPITTLVALLLAPQAALAHFGLEYPSWRADTLADNIPPEYSQWTYPCAGVPSNATGVNRTDWPLDGGSLKLDLHHHWTYIFVSLGLQLSEGGTVSNFNISLTGPTFLNSTGNGTLCIPKLSLPAGFTAQDGQRASIQVVTPGANGAGLYNCADITFRANATTLPASECETSPGVTFFQVQSGSSNTSNCPSSTTGGNGGDPATSPSPSRTGAGSSVGVSTSLLTSVVGVAALLAYGVSW